MTKPTKVSSAVTYLDDMANHFVERDWDYTRASNIESIRYKPEYDYTNKLSYRIKSALRWAFGPTPRFIKELQWGRKEKLRDRFTMPFYVLKRDRNLPDGVLDGGNVITLWEETGEYLNLVQPTVGALLATFLKEEPEHPHAKIITAELDRIESRMKERYRTGEMTGEAKEGPLHISVSRDYLLQRREEILDELGLTYMEWAKKEMTRSFEGKEWDYEAEMDSIDFLLLGDNNE